MLSLTRIFLYNWHRFHDHDIPIDDSLYLAGHHGCGKSLILDAIQLVLVADMSRLHFCSGVADLPPATQPTDDPDAPHRLLIILDSYVRGRVAEDRLLRPGNTVAYIALEFTDRGMRPARESGATPCVMAGVCIEAGEGSIPQCTFFLITTPFDRRLFIHNKRPLTRQELQHSLSNHRDAHLYDQVAEYQTALRYQLGMLNERFFDLLLNALTFQPVRTIHHFIEQWILPAHPLEIGPLQCAVERLDELQANAQQVEEKLAMLRAIIERQDEVKRLRDQHTEFTTLVALLRIAEVEERISDLNDQIDQLRMQISQEEEEYLSTQETLKNAREAFFAAERAMHQSDVVHRREQLQRKMHHATTQADTIRNHWHSLRRDLLGCAQILCPVLERRDDAVVQLGNGEHDAFKVMIEHIEALEITRPPDPALLSLIDSAIPKLETLLQRTYEQHAALKQQMSELHQRGATLNQALARLHEGQREYPKALDHLRDLVTQAVGEQPPLLCELLEIPDERWQNAVEALLGPHRFTLVVQPKHYDIAVQILNRARQEESLANVGLLDIARTLKEECSARPGSLAQQVQTLFPALRPYIDTMLGDMMTCETIEELRHHRRAVTPDVLVRDHWTTCSIPPAHYQPWFVGQRAQQSHIEATERDLQAISEQWTELTSREQTTEALINRLRQVHDLAGLRQRLNDPLDEQPLRDQIAQHAAELQSLDTVSAEALETETERLRGIFEQEQQVMERIVERQMQRKSQVQALEHSLEIARRDLHICEEAAPQTRTRFVKEQGAWNLIYDDNTTRSFSFAYSSFPPGHGLSEAIQSAESSAHDLESRITQELQRLAQEAMTYNTRYQFAAQPGNPDEERYRTEQQRLTATDLPRYQQHSEQTRREIEEELRQHVLHQLRDRLVIARQQFERINDALARLELHGEYYCFQCEPADDMRDYSTMIEETPRLDSGSLFESEFYTRHKATFDRFSQVLMHAPTSEREHHEQQRLTDYRRYLRYDIRALSTDGHTTSLHSPETPHNGQPRSTQMPFYLTIAASFLQLYHVDVRNGQPTIRLALFDKAFALMRQDHIAPVLDLLQSFGLQVIAAAPLERCEYLMPRVCTSLVLTDVGDTVLIEPYRNDDAHLESPR